MNYIKLVILLVSEQKKHPISQQKCASHLRQIVPVRKISTLYIICCIAVPVTNSNPTPGGKFVESASGIDIASYDA